MYIKVHHFFLVHKLYFPSLDVLSSYCNYDTFSSNLADVKWKSVMFNKEYTIVLHVTAFLIYLWHLIDSVY